MKTASAAHEPEISTLSKSETMWSRFGKTKESQGV